MTKDKTKQSKPYKAQIRQGGTLKTLGCFATAEEAALAFAQADKEKKSAAGKPLESPEALMVAEAVRLANEEGLTQEPAETTSGYKGVQYHKGLKSKPYQVQIIGAARRRASASLRKRRRRHSPSRERTGEEDRGGQTSRSRGTKGGGRQLANEEGLKLEPADTTGGYKGVKKVKRLWSKPYQAKIRRDGKEKYLGTFATAEEAALAFARADNEWITVSAARSLAAMVGDAGNA